MFKLLGGWLTGMFLGVPVGFSLLLATFLLIFFYQIGFVDMPVRLGFFAPIQQMTDSLRGFTLLAVPFFVFTGHAMNYAGVTERIFKFARTAVGHITGGLGHVNILASFIFSGMSGTALADAGGLGQLEIKSMKDAGYKSEFAGAVTAASCIIGPLVPPSIPLLIYGVVADTSIRALFLAGVIPGLLCVASLMIGVYFIAKKHDYPKDEKAPASEVWKAFIAAIPALMAPVIIIGGMFSGFVTATEAAIVAALYSLFIGGVVYKELNFKQFYIICCETVRTVSTIALLIIAIAAFGYIVSKLQIAQNIVALFQLISDNPLIFFIIVNLLLLFLGTFIDAFPLLVMVIPLLVPAAREMGIDTVQFGVVAVLNLMIGILTPPMGMALLVVSQVGDVPFHKLTKAILPLLLPLFAVLLLMIVFPPLTLWLPGLFE